MVRQEILMEGKFFLYDRLNRLYFQQTGTADRGDGPVAYMDWTPYFRGAKGWPTLKSARAMARRLAEIGTRVVIVDRKRKVVE